MLTRKRSKSTVASKKLHGGEVFQSSDNFPSGILPTKRQVIERMLSFNHFKKLDTARIVAKELHDKWVWCNVYSLHELTIAQRVQQLMVEFSDLTRYPKNPKHRTDTKSLKVFS